MSAPSVMDVLRRMAIHAELWRNGCFDEMVEADEKALTAVAELVAADREYDEALEAWNSMPNNMGAVGDQAFARLQKSRARRVAALAPFGAPDERR